MRIPQTRPGNRRINDFSQITGMSMPDSQTFMRGLQPNSRSRVLNTARQFGNINRLSAPLSNGFEAFGRRTTFGRAGLAAGMGMLAARNGANMMDRMRYGDYGGAMLSGAMTAAAGYGAYKSWMFKGSMRNALTKAASRALTNIR